MGSDPTGPRQLDRDRAADAEATCASTRATPDLLRYLIPYIRARHPVSAACRHQPPPPILRGPEPPPKFVSAQHRTASSPLIVRRSMARCAFRSVLSTINGPRSLPKTMPAQAYTPAVISRAKTPFHTLKHEAPAMMMPRVRGTCIFLGAAVRRRGGRGYLFHKGPRPCCCWLFRLPCARARRRGGSHRA